MQTDEFLIGKAKRLYEDKTGWGDSDEWTNQDFVILSEKIQERTGVALSYVTLKRVWGKVKYDSLPNTHTLDTLVQFLGYENWRDFKSQNTNGTAAVKTATQIINNGVHEDIKPVLNKLDGNKNTGILKVVLFIVVPVILALLILYINKSGPK